MRTFVFDIETDGLDATKTHVLTISYESQGMWMKRSTNNREDIINFMTCDGMKVGHNVIMYDIPVLERLYGTTFNGVVVDTLALSWYLEEQNKIHGLDFWGEQLGVPKIAIDDWENLSYEDYKLRCETDVEINTLLWLRFRDELQRVYENWDHALKLISYLNFKMKCLHFQEKSKFKLDMERCETGLAQLSALKNEKTTELQALMPKVAVKARKNRPAKATKKDGSPSAEWLKWTELCDNNGQSYDAEVVEYIKGYVEPKAGGTDQVKQWLYSLGWKPITYKFVRNKVTGDTKKIEQIKNDKELCDSVKALIDKEPGVAVLEGLTILTHRIGILKGFLSSAKDGYVKARAQGFTTTLRLKHTEVVNLPKVDVIYGELMRGCLIAPEGYELVGSDMSSLESNTRDHYIYPYDPTYVAELQVKGYDPHIALAIKAGFFTYEDGEWFKAKTIEIEKAQMEGGHLELLPDDKERYSKLKTLRGKGKQTNFSAVYQVGVDTLSRTTGLSKKDARSLLETYWEINWSVKKFAQDCVTKKVGDRTWIKNPVSTFWYILRNDKDRFSAVNQSTGVFVFDLWISNVLKRRPQLTAQFHDEIVLCVKKGHREEVKKLLNDAIDETNEMLKLNIQLGISVAFGDSYADVH